jgi:hypothetical protein
LSKYRGPLFLNLFRATTHIRPIALSRGPSSQKWSTLAAVRDINTINHYLITSDTTDKDKNICNILGPRAPFRTPGPGNLYRLPHPSRRHWWTVSINERVRAKE